MRTIEEVVTDIKNGTWGTDTEYQSEGAALEELCDEIFTIILKTKTIDEFVEKLKMEILEEIQDVSERQKNYKVGDDMSITCSHIMGTLRDVHNRIIDKVVKQLKV